LWITRSDSVAGSKASEGLTVTPNQHRSVKLPVAFIPLPDAAFFAFEI